MQKLRSSRPVEIKIATVVAVNAILHAQDIALLDAAMRDMTGGEPDFFDGELAIIDIGLLDAEAKNLDWTTLINMFRRYRLHPVAVRNASPALESVILSHGLSLDNSLVLAPQHGVPTAPVALANSTPSATAMAPPSPPPAMFSTMIIDTPVRAGQRIYAKGADLVVTAAVNNGAEVIADGSIHIYAPLRGRALAGASGHTEARIFSMSMEAELVSIAGIYRTFENGFPPELAHRLSQVRLVGDRIDILAVNPAT